jgi:hypothetical protein
MMMMMIIIIIIISIRFSAFTKEAGDDGSV